MMQRAASPSSPLSPRIKRKPVPSIDLRYPAPDPADPFAPLWVLRSRPSNPALSLLDSCNNNRQSLSRSKQPPSYDLYPAVVTAGPLVSEPQTQNDHYRRRSQSTPPAQLTVSHLYTKRKECIRDDDTSSSDLESSTVTHQHTSGAIPLPVQITKFLSKANHRSLIDLQPQRADDFACKNSSSASQSSSLSSFVHVSHHDSDLKHANNPIQQCRSRKPLIPSSISAPVPISSLNSTNHLRQQHQQQHNKHSPSLSLASPQHHRRQQHQHQHHNPRRSSPIAEPEWAIPSPSRLAEAANLPVIAPSGLRVPFASLFETHRTIVLFIRHFWCPFCQDYLTSVADVLGGRLTEGAFLVAADSQDNGNNGTTTGADAGAGKKPRAEQVDLVVISNGSPAYIPKYKHLFNLSCKIYTDPSLAVYEALGMGRVATPAPGSIPHSCTNQRCNDVVVVSGGGQAEGSVTPKRLHRASIRDGSSNTYVRHGLVSGIAMVVMRALKTGMPVWERGGDANQLGGEFVLGPGLKCTYAHRMQSTKGHAPIRDVLAAAGVRLPHAPHPHSPLIRLRSGIATDRRTPASPLRRPLVTSPTNTNSSGSPNSSRQAPSPSPSPRPRLHHQRRTNSVYLTSTFGTNVQNNGMMKESGFAAPAWNRRYSVDGANLSIHPTKTTITTPPPTVEKPRKVSITEGRTSPKSSSPSPSSPIPAAGLGESAGGASSEPETTVTPPPTWKRDRNSTLERLKERKLERRLMGAPTVKSLDTSPPDYSKEKERRDGTLRRVVSENGHCSSPKVASKRRTEDDLDLTKVIVIGFTENAGAVDTAKDDEEEGVSPTGATEECNLRLPSLAQTCREFQQPALATLWASIRGIVPIIKCAGKDLWKLDPSVPWPRKLILARPISSSDTVIMKKYASLVRRWEVALAQHDYMPNPASDVWEALQRAFAGTVLFPKLQSIHGYNELMAESAALFGMQNLTSLTIFKLSTGEFWRSMLVDFPAQCPQLTSLRLGTPLNEQEDLQAIVEALPKWPNLTRFATATGTPQVLQALLGRSRLRYIDFSHFTFDSEQPLFPAGIEPHGFPLLEGFRIWFSRLSNLWIPLSEKYVLGYQWLRKVTEGDEG